MNCNNHYTILVDMDDTITNLLDNWIHWLNIKHGTSVKPEKVTDWEIDRFFPKLTRHEVFEPIFTEDFWNTVTPKKDAIHYVKRLIDDGYKVYICTNTNYKTMKPKMEKVLFKYFDYLTWNDVIVTGNKQMVNADFLVDDGVHNLVEGNYKGILMDAPHNWYFDEKEHGITRVKNWKEVYYLIKELTK